MSLDDLLKKAKEAGKTALENLTDTPVEDASQPPERRLRYLVELEQTAYTPEEVRDMLPELQEFAKQAQPRKRLRTKLNLSKDLLDELSKHFSSPIEMEEWLLTPNEAFDGESPLGVSRERLLNTLKEL